MGDASALEGLGPWSLQADDVTTPGDAFELEQLGTFVLPTPDPIAPQGDASELEFLGAWTP